MVELVNITAEDWNRTLRQISRLRTGMMLLLLLVVLLVIAFFMLRPGQAKVIRTQGLVIVDAQGHDRILIGAPVPTSKDRTRKDDASDGIIFLGKTGADRLALGQWPATFIGGKSYNRIGDGDNYGMILYDTKGSERGGMGFMGMGRVGLMLDRATPPFDAVGMMVDDKEDFAGLMINYGDPKARDSAIELGTDLHSVHIKINGKDGLPRANLNFDGTSKPAWQFDDAASAAAVAKAAQGAAH